MPHDKRGQLLRPGDRVILRGKIKLINPSENYCNCTIELEEPMPTDTGPRSGETVSGINCRQLESQEPVPVPVNEDGD